MMVYVLNKDGHPLMPTARCGKVRRLLRDKKAKVVRRCPFTIQLLYKTTEEVQEITLGIDAGSKHIGASATTEDRVLYEADVELRNDIVSLLSSRREARRTRRNRLRYREKRFSNRVKSKQKGWVAPSIRQKIESHICVIQKIMEILPISEIIVETASFDIQKIKNPSIKGKEYQQGEQLDFWNTREFVLFRDGHICQCCKGKSKDKILNVHHIESRKTGGDSPSNLVTLCETCHKGFHDGKIKLPSSVKRGAPFRDATFMGIMRWKFYDELKALYPDMEIKNTYGYITKSVRIANGLPKEHYVDARCISGHPNAKSDATFYYQKKVRCHNRQIYKAKTLKRGIRKKNQTSYDVKGFHLFDKVLYQGKEYFVFGRRATGFFDIRELDGNKVNKGSVSCRKLKRIENKKYYLIERRKAFLPA